jgi:hypothetical protein
MTVERYVERYALTMAEVLDLDVPEETLEEQVRFFAQRGWTQRQIARELGLSHREAKPLLTTQR